MEHKYTPGPWEITSHRPPYSEENDFPGVGISIPDAELASGIHKDAIEVWGENSEANARLIAASPDLLTALIALREYLSKCPPHAGDTTGAEWGRVMDQSGAAIIKATGSQT